MVMSRYAFLVQQYASERLKTLAVWSEVSPAQMHRRLEPRGRSPHEQMVHQCLSEDGWMTKMLGIAVPQAGVPPEETLADFIGWYAAASDARLAALRSRDDAWFEALVPFFDAERSRAWVLLRRLTHSAHHRGQLQALLRADGAALWSVYGPTADTGGLPAQGGLVRYRYADLPTLLAAEVHAAAPRPELLGRAADLPAPTERSGA